MCPNKKLEDPRGYRPFNSHHFYYSFTDGRWKYSESVIKSIPDIPCDWGLERIQEQFISSSDDIAQKECQLPNILASKYFRSQNLNHQKRLRKQFNRKQFNRKQFNRKR